MSEIYWCDGCGESHCGTCNPQVCDHGNQLCHDQAADYCGACLTDMAWDRADVIAIYFARGK